MLRRVQHEVQTDEEDEGPGGSDDKLAVHLGNPNLNPNLGFFFNFTRNCNPRHRRNCGQVLQPTKGEDDKYAAHP